LYDIDFGHGFWTPVAALAAGEWRLLREPAFVRLV
jgi:hypothetical protein